MPWDTVIVFSALIVCNLLSSCFQCVTGFGDILCLQILWEVCVSISPDIFHASPLSTEDFHFITILSYVRSLFVHSVLACLLFYQEQRDNKRRLLEGLKPLISDFNATLLTSLAVPALIGAAIGVVTLDYMSEAALRIILGTTSFFFALTFLALQMMKRLEHRKLRDIIRNDLVDMHISMVINQQSRQLAAVRKAQARRRARRRRALRRRRLKYDKQYPHSPLTASGSELALGAGPSSIIASQHTQHAHTALGRGMSYDEVSSPLTDVGAAVAMTSAGAHLATDTASVRLVPNSSNDAGSHGHDRDAKFSFDNDSFADTQPDLLSLVRQRLAEMSEEASVQPVDQSMRETAHHTLQLLQEKEASAMLPGSHHQASRFLMKQSRDNVLSIHSGSALATPTVPQPVSHTTSVRSVPDHSTLLAGPGPSLAMAIVTSGTDRISAPVAARNAHAREELDKADDGDDTHESESASDASTSRTEGSTMSFSTSNAEDAGADQNARLQRILQRAALTGSFAAPSTMLAVRPTTMVGGAGAHARVKKSKHKERSSHSAHGSSKALQTKNVDFAGSSDDGANNESSSTTVMVETDTTAAGAPPSTVLVTANAELLAAQQHKQLQSLQHATRKSRPLSAHFVRMDGAVVSGAVAASFVAGLLGSYVGTGDAPHVIFGLAMRIGDAVFRKNMPASNVLPGLLRFVLGFTYDHYSSALVWYYVVSVLAGWAGVFLGLASPVRAESRGYIASVLASLLLASFVTLTDSAWKQALATLIVVAIVAYVIVKENKPPSMHEVELPPPPSTPTTMAERVAFSKYWDREEEKMTRRRAMRAREFEESGVDVKRRARVDLEKHKHAKDVTIEGDQHVVSAATNTGAREPSKPPVPPAATKELREEARRIDADDDDGELLPV